MPDLTPTFSCTLSAPGSGTRNTERGYSLFDPMEESAFRSDYTWTTWGAMGYSSEAGVYDDPSLKYISEIQALICQPQFRYSAAELPITHFGAVGSGGDSWEELTGNAANLPISTYHQLDASLTGENGLYYLYPVPPQPAFGVAIERLPVTSSWNYAASDAWTRIVWAGGRFELLIPWDRAARLYDYTSGRRLVSEVPISANSSGHSAAQGAQQLLVWIMHLKGRVLISWDFCKSFFVYSRGDKAENAISTPAGAIQVTNLGSRWSFGLIPIYYPSTGRFKSKVYDKGYLPTSTLEGGGAGNAAADYMYNLWAGRPAVGLVVSTIPQAAGERYLQYQVDMTPVNYPTGSTYFGHSPELYSVRLQNKPVTGAGPTGTPDSIENDIIAFTITNSEDADYPTCTMTLDNNQGQGHEELQEYGIVDLNLKAHDSDTTYDAFDGYILEVSPQNRGPEKWVEVTCAGLMLPFHDIYTTEAEPVFSGRTVGEAIEWAALRCGVDFTKEDYETTTALPLGLDGKRGWQPATGRPWADFLKQVCGYEQKYLYFDGTTLKYMGEPDENVITWHFKVGTTVEGAPEEAIPIIKTLQAPRNPAAHRNEVRVVGRDVDGRLLVAVKKDSANLDSVGWEKSVVIQDDSLDTQEAVNLVCSRVFNKVSRFPPRTVSFRLRGSPQVKVRDIVKLWGGDAKVDQQIFRVRSVTHTWDRESHPQFWTEIVGQWLRDDS
jgi:hypothetical protein